MLQDMISKTVVMDAAEQFKHVLPCTEENIQLMKKALILYRKDSVYRVKPMSGHTVSAYVQDVVPVKVFIDLADVKKAAVPALLKTCAVMCLPFTYIYMHNMIDWEHLRSFGRKRKNAAKTGRFSDSFSAE